MIDTKSLARSLPAVETFHTSQQDFMCADSGTVQGIMLDAARLDCDSLAAAAAELAGWYWWYCEPGCLPDSDPFGPFDTEAIALADAHGLNP